MMDTNDDRLSMSGTSVTMGDIPEPGLLSNIEHMHMMDDNAIMQFISAQQYMMPSDNQPMSERNVIHGGHGGHGSSASHLNEMAIAANVDMTRHSIDTCNYVTTYEQQYHESPDSQSRYKYQSSAGLSSPNMTPVSETVTHVSETDNSLTATNNFPTVSTSVSSVPQMNVRQNYNMSSVNNWGHTDLNTNHLHASKDLASMNAPTKVMPLMCHSSKPRISNFIQSVPSMAPSTTSTPVSQTLNTLNAVNNHNKNHMQNHNKDNQQSKNRLELQLGEKRTVITFRVVDQVVDHTGKVVKETVIKNEEIIKSLGKTQWNESISPSSTISSVSRFPSTTNSGVLADISSSGKSGISATLDSAHYQTNELMSKVHSSINELDVPLGKSPVIAKEIPDFVASKGTSEVRPNAVSGKKSNEVASTPTTSIMKKAHTGISDTEEEERRETATALLSLQTQRGLNIDVNSNDQFVLNNSSLRQGSRIMAKWRDKNYYPAVISKFLPQNNKWMVTFEDKATRNLFENELISVEYLTEGQDVMVNISEGFCAKGTIRNVKSEEFISVYEVEHLKDDKKVAKEYALKDLFLNGEQGASLTLKSAKHSINGAVFADVDLDNIVSGKRSRTSKQDVIPDKNLLFKNGRRRNAESSVDLYCIDNEDNDNSIKIKKKAINIRGNKKKVESLHTHFNSEHSLSISPRTTKASISMPQQEIIKLLGPLPENIVMFEGVFFLLTCGDRGNKNDEMCNEESNPERSTPFDKSYLSKQIEIGGGKIFESFEEVKKSENNYDIVLIADTYHRSIKYIQCLAAGIPIVSHLWVIDCCRQNKYLKRDNYILPAGFSIITNALPSDKSTFKKSSTLFKGTKFYFGSKTPEKLENLWSPVLAAAQAVIVEQIAFANITRKTVDIIIGDPSCPNELIKKAKLTKIPIISSEYIVQCLINGRKLPYDQSIVFSYTYKNKL